MLKYSLIALMTTGSEVDANSRGNDVPESLLSSFSLVVLWRIILIWFVTDHQGMKKNCITQKTAKQSSLEGEGSCNLEP